MKQVKSYEEFLSCKIDKQKVYLLLYKAGSQTSECAFTNIAHAAKQVAAIHLFYADVTVVKDIHIQYNVTSAPALLEFEKGKFINLIKGCNDTQYYKALFENAIYLAAVSNTTNQKRVTVYSTPTCTWCNTLKAYLRKHHIPFTDIDVSKDQRMADELVKRSGQMGVPQTDINGEIIVGFNQTRINQLLGIKSN